MLSSCLMGQSLSCENSIAKTGTCSSYSKTWFNLTLGISVKCEGDFKAACLYKF